MFLELLKSQSFEFLTHTYRHLTEIWSQQILIFGVAEISELAVSDSYLQTEGLRLTRKLQVNQALGFGNLNEQHDGRAR